MVSSVACLGLDPRSFSLVAESESSCSESADPTAVSVHADGEPCNCPCECREYCEEFWDERDAHRFPH